MVTRFGLLSTLSVKKAYTASLHSDRFGSDATHDKQLSLASRVSHSGLDPESPKIPRDEPSPRYTKGILNRVQDDKAAVIPDPDPESPQRSRRNPSSLYVRGILNQVQDDRRPSPSNTRRVLSPDNTPNAPFTIAHHTHQTHPTHSTSNIQHSTFTETCRHSSLFTLHYSLDNFPGKLS